MKLLVGVVLVYTVLLQEKRGEEERGRGEERGEGEGSGGGWCVC